MNRSEFDYKKYLQLVIKHRYLYVGVALLIMTGVVAVSHMIPETYEAKCTVFIEKSMVNELVKGIAAAAPSYDDKVRILSYAITSRALLLKVFDDLKLNATIADDVQREKMVRDFQKRTDVKMKDQQGVFIISFQDTNPRFARDYVNALVRRYVEENTSSKREETSAVTKMLEEQISAMKTKLDGSEVLVDNFKRNNAGVLGQSEATLLAEINDAQQKIEETVLKRQQLEGLQTMARKNDPLQAKLASLQARQKELSLIYTDSHPELVSINTEIAAVREQYESGRHRADLSSAQSPEVQRIAMEINSLRSMERGQRRIIAAKQHLLRNLPEAKSTLGDMERELNSQKNLYGQLKEKHSETMVAKQMGVQDKSTTFRVIDPAIVPTTPVDPKRTQKLLMGIVASLIASLGLLILRDHLDSSVRSVDTLKSLGVQVLAIVPTIETPAEIQAVRRRDFFVFTLAGTYFIAILATVTLGLLR